MSTTNAAYCRQNEPSLPDRLAEAVPLHAAEAAPLATLCRRQDEEEDVGVERDATNEIAAHPSRRTR